MAIVVCILIAAALAGIIMAVVRSKLKSVRTERSACNYTRSGSFHTSNAQDIFLFSRVTKVPKPQNNSNNSRGGRRR